MRLIWTRSTRKHMSWLSRMKNAKAKEDVVDTKESLVADAEFLMRLKEKCTMTDNPSDECHSACSKRVGRFATASITRAVGSFRPAEIQLICIQA